MLQGEDGSEIFTDFLFLFTQEQTVIFKLGKNTVEIEVGHRDNTTILPVGCLLPTFDDAKLNTNTRSETRFTDFKKQNRLKVSFNKCKTLFP